MTEAPQGPRVGALLADRFRVLEVIGRGGMGMVVRAFDRVTSTEVAVKHVRPDLATDPDYAERLLREASLARDVSHHNVCRVHDVYRHGDEVLLSMEYVQGETLRKRLDRGPVSAQEALHIARQVCAGVAAAHEKGVVHRDLKPENVLIDTAGRAVVLDFGVARREGTPRDTVTGIALGTPRYMSPEQQMGRAVTPASDVYSLGLLVEELFGGRPPSWLRPIIRKATERDPTRRYRDAAALGKDLQRPWLRASSLGMVAGWGLAAVAALALVIHPGPLLSLMRVIISDGGTQVQPARDVQKTLLTRQWGGAQLGTVSPDGKLLGYMEANNGVTEGLLRPLRDVNAPPRRFSLPDQSVTWLAFSPDGKRVVYSTGRHFLDRGSEIFVAEVGDGAAPRRLGTGTTPAFGPDGATVVFSRYNPDTVRWHLAVLPPVGEAPEAIKTDPPARQELSPAVSPDGKRIAYVAGPTPGGLRVVPARGGAVLTLDEHPVFYDRVQWTPDGKRLVYDSERGGELLAIPADGSGPAATMLSASDLPHHPSMTADGKLLVYTRSQQLYELWVADRGGGSSAMVRVNVPTDYLGWPLFSPDGKSFALQMGSDGKEQVMQIPRAGGTGQVLSQPRSHVIRPESFVADGQALIIGSDRAGGLEVVSVTGAPPPPIQFSPNDVHAVVSPDEKFLATTRHDVKSPMADGLWVRPLSAPPDQAVCWIEDGIGTPAWSADGKLIAAGTSKGLVAISSGPDQTRRIQLRDGSGAPLRPKVLRFGNDGKLIILDYPRIYEADPQEGAVARPIIQPQRIENFFGFSLSPDGKQIAYVIQPTNSDLWLVESPQRLLLAHN